MAGFERVTEIIKEIAVNNCHDYPGIDCCSSIEQLYAIEESMKGIVAANTDLHQVILKLRGKLDMSLDEYIDFLSVIAEEKRLNLIN